MEYSQSSFAGGINMVLDETRTGDDQYIWAFNVRNRYDTLTPVKQTVLDSTAPAGKKQGLVAVGEYLVLFNSGKAYYKLSTATSWTEITGFSMSPTVDIYYTAFVPASTINYKRVSADNLNTEFTNTLIATTPQALVVQDGINQPFVIFPDASARVTKNYSEWSNDVSGNREYVPIGKQMMFLSGRLYVVSADGKYVFRSLTNRPLDFMLNITSSGDKLPTEAEGGVLTTALAFGFDGITCIAPMSPDSFFVSSVKSSVIVTIDYDNLLFGEPRHNFSTFIPVGCVNERSFVDISGNFGFIDFEGFRSFNAVMNLKFEGRNDIFSLNIAPALVNILQSQLYTAAINYDNYAFFSVDTIFGYVIVVYDTLNKQFVSFDQTDAIKIIQFAHTLPYNKQLYAITESNVYKLFASESPAFAVVRTKAFPIKDKEGNTYLKGEQTIKTLSAVFVGSEIAGSAYATVYVDGMNVITVEKSLEEDPPGIDYPADYPVTFASARNVNRPVFNFTRATGGSNGWKFAFIIRWDNGSTLTNIQASAEIIGLLNPTNEKVKI